MHVLELDGARGRVLGDEGDALEGGAAEELRPAPAGAAGHEHAEGLRDHGHALREAVPPLLHPVRRVDEVVEGPNRHPRVVVVEAGPVSAVADGQVAHLEARVAAALALARVGGGEDACHGHQRRLCRCHREGEGALPPRVAPLALGRAQEDALVDAARKHLLGGGLLELARVAVHAVRLGMLREVHRWKGGGEGLDELARGHRRRAARGEGAIGEGRVAPEAAHAHVRLGRRLAKVRARQRHLQPAAHASCKLCGGHSARVYGDAADGDRVHHGGDGD
mmetsp:Transcript_17652/g.55002  ORF Transcript_17652/g.55002 Transcript_17652/m.55002 type:complete len:279 (+) Transcript_17652:559-1395(+)